MTDSLFRIISNSNTKAPQEVQLRTYTLNILYRVKQLKQYEVNIKIDTAVNKHIKQLKAEKKEAPARAEAYDEEIDVCNKVLDAHNIAPVINFPNIKPVDQDQSRDMSSASALRKSDLGTKEEKDDPLSFGCSPNL